MGFPLTVVVLTRNEETNIERCLKSVDWCDERVIVDDGSTDRTCELAESLGARVLHRRFDSFAGQRNWALSSGELRNDWVLMLDADEWVPPDLRQELERDLPSATPETAAFRMCRKTMFLGRWLKYSDGFPVWIMRLVRNGRAQFADSGHGEVPVPPVDGLVGTVRTPFVHEPFSHGISQWVDRHNRYSTREAIMEHNSDLSWRWSGLFSKDKAERRRTQRTLSRLFPGRPVLRFFYQYILKGGFLEGRSGLAFSLLMATYEGLTVVKRWELELASQARADKPTDRE